jgi:hypothetical protein
VFGFLSVGMHVHGLGRGLASEGCSGKAEFWLIRASWLLLFVALYFAWRARTRGVGREGYVTVAVLSVYALFRWAEELLVKQVNRFYKFGLVGFRAIALNEDPATAWDAVKDLPPLVESGLEKFILSVVVLILVIIVADLLTRPRKKEAPSLIEAFRAAIKEKGLGRRVVGLLQWALGVAMGAVNGYLIANFTVNRAFSLLTIPDKLVFVLPSAPLQEALQVNLVPVLAILLLVVVVIAVLGLS